MYRSVDRSIRWKTQTHPKQTKLIISIAIQITKDYVFVKNFWRNLYYLARAKLLRNRAFKVFDVKTPKNLLD